MGSEAGETLVELLLTIVIIGITAAAVLGALVTSVAASGEHRRIAAVDTLLKSYAENATYQIELAPSPRYTACATAGTYANLPWTPPPGYTPADGYAVSVSGVEAWDASSNTFDSAGSCTNGLQMLTVLATGPAGVRDTLSIVVRKPAYDPANASF